MKAEELFNRYAFVAIFLGALVFYVLTAGDPIPTGDSAQYVTLAKEGDILEIPSHVGHLALGWLAVHVLPFLGPEAAVQGVSILFGALGVASVYQAVVYHVRDRITGLIAALALMVAGEYWYYATIVEVYVMQAGALMAGYVLWLYAGRRDPCSGEIVRGSWRALLNGVLAAAVVLLAGLASPSSVAFLPMFLFGRTPRIPRWLLVGGIVVGLAGLALVGALLAEPLLIGREIRAGLYPPLRSLTFGGLSLGLVVLTSIALIVIKGLCFENDAAMSREAQRVMWGVVVTGLIHLPFGAIISEGPYIPVYGLVTLVFGLALAWLRRQKSLSRRAVLGAGSGFSLALGLSVLGFAGGCQLRPQVCTLANHWLLEYRSDLLIPALIVAVLSIVLVFAWMMQRAISQKPGPDPRFVWTPLVVVIATALAGLSLDIVARHRIATDQVNAIRILSEIDPPAASIIGSYTALMLYDYYRLGRAEWETEHIWVDELTPDRLEKALARYGQVYLLGRYGRRFAEEEGGVILENYELEPLDGQADMLWVIRRRE